MILAPLILGLSMAVSTTAPAGSQTLADGAILYTPPPTWKSLGITHDNLSAGYAPAEHDGQIVIVVVREQQTIPDDLAPKLALQFGQAIRAEAKKGNIEIVQQPKVEDADDKRFLLKLHDQFKAKGKFSDRVQLFRGVGRNLVSLTVNAFTQDADRQKEIDQIAEQMMLSVQLNRPGITLAAHSPPPSSAAPPATQPVLFASAHLRLAPPADWTAAETGQPSGLIVTWHDPASDANVIVLTYRLVPAVPSDDPAAVDAAVDQLAASEQPAVSSPDAQASGPATTIADHRFLRKTSADYQLKDAKLRVTLRQVRAGDGVVSITSISTVERADEIDAMADQIALSVRATR